MKKKEEKKGWKKGRRINNTITISSTEMKDKRAEIRENITYRAEERGISGGDSEEGDGCTV